MPVDSFKYLPRLIAAVYQATQVERKRPIPWTLMTRPLHECKFGLLTSAGLYDKECDPPFDIEREKQTPTWGDPTFRRIPLVIEQVNIGASHLHINTADLLEDVNIVLPLQRFQELTSEGIIGSMSDYHYSFMGYQGYPPDTAAWEKAYGPQVAARFKADSVDCVLLTPA